METIDENFEFRQDLNDFSVEKRNYCLFKRQAELEIFNLRNKGLKVSIARCFAFYGKYLPKNQHYAYGNFIGQAENGENIIVKSNGIVYRSYMHADELVISLIKILLKSSLDCPIYNLGSDKSEKLHEVAQRIANQYGVKCIYNLIDEKLILDRYVPNINKLKILLNEE